MGKITNHDEFTRAQKAYSNDKSFKGMSGKDLKAAMSEYYAGACNLTEFSTTQYFGESVFEGSRKNKATL